MEKKKILITLGCVIGLLLVIGISYAYWSLTFTQTENNVVMTDCFEIEFIEGNAINLSKAYPVNDSEGMKNVPYTFTIKNICDSSAKYQINLETLTPNGKKLPDQYLAVNLMESNVSKITSKLDSSLNSESTIEGAVSAYKLYNGILGPNEEKEFSLRIWMHGAVTADMKDSMNATYKGKISVITSYYLAQKGTLMFSNLDEHVGGTTGAFWDYKRKVTKVVFENELRIHEDAEHTFDVSEAQDGSVMSYLVKQDLTSNYILYIQGDGGVYANSNSLALFADFTSLKEIENLHFLDTSKVINMMSMFYGCSSLTNLDVSHFDTSKVENMRIMFYKCSSLTNINVSNFNTSNVTNMGGMFQYCNGLINVDLSGFDTSQVKKMDGMFAYCTSLGSINLDHFDTSNVIDMSFMFNDCKLLINIGVSHFDTNNVTDMSQMFYGCQSLTNLDLSSFNTSNVTNMRSMFAGCTSLVNLDIRNFDFSSLTDERSLFRELSEQLHLIVKDESVKNYILNDISSESSRPSGWNDSNFEIL